MFKLFKSKTWARATVQSSIRNAYLQKEKFSLDEQDQIADMLTQLKKEASATQKQVHQVSLLQDDNLKSDPLQAPSEGIRDARDTFVQLETSGGGSKWVSKQSGF